MQRRKERKKEKKLTGMRDKIKKERGERKGKNYQGKCEKGIEMNVDEMLNVRGFSVTPGVGF